MHRVLFAVGHFASILVTVLMKSVSVYDVASRESFEHLDYWLSDLDRYSTKSGCVRMLVGNKVDLVSQT